MTEHIIAENTGSQIEPAGVVERYALSPLQEGMLFHHLSAPEAGTDVEQIVCTLKEEVRPDYLRNAWEQVIERHAVLRTRFEFETSGEVIQAVMRTVSVPWEVCDWRSVGLEARDQMFASLLRDDRHRSFDFNKAPLLRLTLVRVDENEYRLLWTFHHLLLDGRSFPLVLNEVFTIYEALLEGRKLQLPESRPYRDFIDWLQSCDYTRSESYWRKQLVGMTAATPVVVDRGTHALNGQATERQGDCRVFLSESTTSALKQLARNQNVTLNTILHAAWAVLLSRYSDEETVAFGVVRACRKGTIAGAEDMIGLFINTLPFRVRVPGEMSLADWLMELRAQWIELREHEHTPLVQIQKWSDVAAGRPLFESILMFENYELNLRMQEQGGKWRNRSFRLYEQTGYPITLTVYSGLKLCLQIEFDRSRFEFSTITRMMSHLRTLLEGMLANSTQRVLDLPLLAEEEQRQLIVDWNATERHFSDKTVHRLFEEQVEKSPDSIAVTFHNQHITYGNLNSRANQIAHYLKDLEIQNEDLVGICVERSADMVAAMLGIWKSGAAYVPLDPAFPKERLAQILQDSQVKVLLTERHLTELLSGNIANTVYLDAPEIAHQSRENVCREMGPRNLAYVIYTSGSTGRPKGVQIEHRALVNFLESMAREPGLIADDVLVAVTTFSFDIAGLELFLPLIRGARVVIADRQTAVDPRSLAQLLEISSATMIQATPSTWRMLIESGWPGRKNAKILCGGEALPPELAKELLGRCSSLWNMYGPTETTVWSTVSHVTEVGNAVPIGKPIANTLVYVLDRRLRPVPIGVPGELFIGGAGVARGYWKRADLTAERFIPNSFAPDNGACLYRTGDLCRWREDGSLECLGRNDYQVKIRGYRIELGDIEAALGTHPHIQHSVVSVQEDGGDKKLVAYVILSSGKPLNTDELRKHLSDRLPDYMVPPAFVALERFPLTPNGKVDRKTLPRVEVLQNNTAIEGPAPVNEMETRIARIWEQILGIARVSRNSNFFDLGADSLSIMRARNRLEQAIGKEFAIVEIFRNPTVKSLAQFLSANESINGPAVHRRPQTESQKIAAKRRAALRQTRSL